MPDVENAQPRPDRPTRRQLLVGAGVTSVVWAAPAVLTLQPASAAGSPPPPDGVCGPVVLSGGPSASDEIGVDDDWTVYVNGVPVLVDNDQTASNHPPVQLGVLADGATVRVVAKNRDCCSGDPVQLSPLYLHCTTSGATQVLDATGVPPGGTAGAGEVFYDKTFTVNL